MISHEEYEQYLEYDELHDDLELLEEIIETECCSKATGDDWVIE